jgi:ATP-dependent exoDNAse (exonuclease V) beta subunit
MTASLQRLSLATLRHAERQLGQDFLRDATQVLTATARERIALGETDPDWLSWGEAAAGLRLESACLAQWRLLGRYFLTSTGSIRIQFNAQRGLPGVAPAYKALVKELSERLLRTAGAAELLDELMNLPQLELSKASRSALQALTTLLPFAASVLQEMMTAQGLQDLVAVSGRARQALVSNSEPTDLALRLGESLQHILVDEFQDTSVEQFELLQNLTQDWSAGDGRSLLLVGDPMQSIYGFRDAEVALFMRARRLGIGALTLKTLELQQNFRSAPTLVEFANQSFPPLLPPVDDPESSQVAYCQAIAARAATTIGEVRFHLLARQAERRAQDLEAARIVTLVGEIRREFANDSIAILTQTRKNVAGLTELLRAQGWPVRGIKMVSLAELPAIQDLRALTSALIDPMDRVAWLSVLRAPWCGATLDVLEALASAAGEGPIISVLQDCLARDDWPAGVQPRLKQLAPLLLAAYVATPQDGIAVSVSRVWTEIGGPACLDQATSLRDAQNYLDRLAQAVAGRDWRGRASLEFLTKDLYADAGPETGLEILPVHQAKGLEYDHVILAGLAIPWPAEKPRLLAWRVLPSVTDGAGELLIAARPDAAATEDDGLYKFLARLQKQRVVAEKMRLMYVAATRARRSLHWVATLRRDPNGDWKQPAANSTLSLLWPVLADSFRAGDRLDRVASNIPIAATETRSVRPLRRLPDDWQLPGAVTTMDTLLRPAAVQRRDQEPEFYWAGIESRHIGTVLHAALHRLAVEARAAGALPTKPADHADWAAELAALGVAPTRIAYAVARIGAALGATLDDPKGRWLLDPKHPEAYCEQAYSGVLDGELLSIVVDRYFVDQHQEHWIVDYKSGQHLGGSRVEFLANEKLRYQPQMSRYCRLLAEQGRPARAALYFPLLQEIVYYD